MPIVSRRMICAVAIAATLAVLTAAPTASAAPRNKNLGLCPMQGESQAHVTSVDERLDITLDDGRILHLAGLEPRRTTPEAPEGDLQARDELAAQIKGSDISFTAVAQKPDRWGRIPVLAFIVASDQAKRSIGDFLLRAGLARLMPQIEIRPCLKDWLSAEAEARAAGLGLWADPYYAIIAAGDAAAFAEKAATNVIVEGRLTHTSTNRFGLRLEFGSKTEFKTAADTDTKADVNSDGKHGRNFSVIILQRNIKIFERAGMKLESLIGRTLRVRGLLDMRFSPQIEVASPDEIEVTLGDDSKAQFKVRASQTETTSPVPPEEP